MKKLEQYSLQVSQLLILIVVLLTTWPILQHPRLEDDDYRYLHLIQQMETGAIGAVESMAIENRWDHLWFMNEDGMIRFFRPTVVLSYALDHKLWGDRYACGLTASNVAIHLMCCWLVAFILHRLLGAGLASISGSLLFAGLATHAECIWYIAGRTDTLAALGFLGAFALHIAGRRWWALPLFAFGFLTKEMVIVAPAVFLAYDAWISNRRMDRKLFATYVGLITGVLLVKKIALGGEGSDWVYPYLIKPFTHEFYGHLWLQFRSYAGNLLAAEPTMPFADSRTVSLIHQPVYTVLAALLLLMLSWFLRKDKRFWLLSLLAILTWLPTSFVYLSERYLYLPSLAYVGLLGLLVLALSGKVRNAFSLLLLAYATFHVIELRVRHAEIASKPGSLEEMIGQLEPVRDKFEQADRLLLINFPGYFVRAQFAEDIFRVVYDRPEMDVDVLTMMPGQSGTIWAPGDAWPSMGAGLLATRTGDQQVTLAGRVFAAGQPPETIMEPPVIDFSWVPLSIPGHYQAQDFEAHVIDCSPAGATKIMFRFSQPLDGSVALVWQADCSDLNKHPWIRRQKATVRVVNY